MQSKKVRKAVIAAAGFGTRFLPQTKAMPKEMLPIVDKPIIQYIVEELVSVGVKDIIIVTGYTKRSIEDHFDSPNAELTASLKKSGQSKELLLKQVEAIGNLANFIYIRQKGPYGNATPLLNVEHLIGNEPFFFTFGDDFISAKPQRFQQMIDIYEVYQAPVMSAVKALSDTDYDKRGFAGGKEIGNGLIDVKVLSEKPGKSNAPSDLATVSGVLLTPEFFTYLHQAQDQLIDNQELNYNHALQLMVKDNQRVLAYQIQNGKYYDAGSKLEYLKTVVDFALKDKDINLELKSYLRDLLID